MGFSSEVCAQHDTKKNNIERGRERERERERC